jgi:5,10-methylene-tetrahydrofolate dehydrogenase/methenyl tetrahydrofolate cyclohydrolase
MNSRFNLDNQISGIGILKSLRETLAGYEELFKNKPKLKAVIILIHPSEDEEGLTLSGKDWIIAAYRQNEDSYGDFALKALASAKSYQIAEKSADQKKKILNYLGFDVEIKKFPCNVSVSEIREYIRYLNGSKQIKAIIIQHSLSSKRLPDEVSNDIDLSKDIDALNPRNEQIMCATAEGIGRLLHPFLLKYSDAKIAIRGVGFVGRDVCEKLIRLEENGGLGIRTERIITIDQRYGSGRRFCLYKEGKIEATNEDNILQDVENKIIISATGDSTSIESQYLERQEEDRIELIVDAGFICNNDDCTDSRGDINKLHYGFPRRITPVPGGVGPIEMTIIAERMVDIQLQSNNLSVLKPWYLTFDEDNHLILEFPGWSEQLMAIQQSQCS